MKEKWISRITKYNPKYRNNSGFYQKNDWTSISDIGKIFEGKKLTDREYLKIEDAYVETIILFFDFLNLNSFVLAGLDKHEMLSSQNYTSSMIKAYNTIYPGQQITRNEITNIVRLRLREDISCKLKNKDMFVHFGYDYYMYIGSSKKVSASLVEKIENSGLFVEEFESPYLEEDEK